MFCTYSKAWFQSMACVERPKPIICKPESAGPADWSCPCSFWVSCKTTELTETDRESMVVLALISAMSVGHSKLLSPKEDEDVPLSNLLLDESHQFPLVLNSSAMLSFFLSFFYLGNTILAFSVSSWLLILPQPLFELLWFDKMNENGLLHHNIFILPD